MDQRFSKLFNLTEAQAIAILDTPYDPTSAGNPRYTAAAHLINFPTSASINALMRAVKASDPALDNRIVCRKAVESLGRLQASQALPLIRDCLSSDDRYMVENAVWAIGEIGSNDAEILADIAQLLDQSQQGYRVIIQTLAKLEYKPAIERIRKFVKSDNLPIASAAIAAICRFTQDFSAMEQVVAMLQHPNVVARRLSIQDLMDAQYYGAIPAIAASPISLVFRLRGIRELAKAGLEAGVLTFNSIQATLEQTLYDHPTHLNLVHQYDPLPALSVLIRDLYDTDFGRCYLASQLILDYYSDAAPDALLETYAKEANHDYGAHYHVIKLLGWLKYAPAYDLFIEALQNPQPQFQKSRAAAAIALGELGIPKAISDLRTCLRTQIWDLKYATLMALDQLGYTNGYNHITDDDDWLIRAKYKAALVPH